MKKTLIALAVLGASGAVMAQSSVTLYGVADAGFGKIERGSTLSTLPADPVLAAVAREAWDNSDATNKTQFISGSLMNNGNSRIGVRGVEDLGGGLKAGFNFESGLDLDTGYNARSGDGFWARAANVWLGGNWGTVKLGRSLNPSFYGAATWELTGMANYSVIGNTYGFPGGGPRNNSQFSYKTPDFGGFNAEVAYVTKADNGDKAKWDLNLIYANGPIGAALSANKTQDGKTSYALGGKYNFGNFTLAAAYLSARPTAAVTRNGFSLGGTAVFGALSLTLDVTRDTKMEDTGVKGKKYTNGLLEAKYALSKRTFVYGAYLRLDKTNNYGLGVRHNF